jgi:hypothetical protein
VRARLGQQVHAGADHGVGSNEVDVQLGASNIVFNRPPPEDLRGRWTKIRRSVLGGVLVVWNDGGFEDGSRAWDG